MLSEFLSEETMEPPVVISATDETSSVDAVRAMLGNESAIFSPRFWPRAFAIAGHMLAAQLLIGGGLLLLVLLGYGLKTLAANQ